jgi:hypothetical protein
MLDGCDSIIITEILLLPSDTISLTAFSCDPAQTGMDTLVLTNQAGCDSVIITDTQLLPSDTISLTALAAIRRKQAWIPWC